MLRLSTERHFALQTSQNFTASCLGGVNLMAPLANYGIEAEFVDY
jgi:hypothetical protein